MAVYNVVRKENEAILEIKGHANYGPYGTDIVCSSISTACIFTANLIEKLNLGYNVIDLVCDEGYFRLQIKTTDFVSNAIFENLEAMLEDVAKQYPKYLKLKLEES
ncbi:MAG: ribosomal-processing cysteine protease Prp [Anaeroplasmataceae bacterium]|nr:ribosomal-processing cysteine protease Prp [Anaeroplasmataceae bacterium]